MKTLAAFIITLLLSGLAWGGPGGLATDRWSNFVQGFAPYSTVALTFTGASNAAGIASSTFPITVAVLGIRGNCSAAGTYSFNSQSGMSTFPFAASTDFTIVRNSNVSSIRFRITSSATINTCKISIN